MVRPLAIASVVISLSLTASVALGAEKEPSGGGTFRPTGSLALGRNGHTATLLPDGRVLVIGGREKARFSAEVWDPATGSFSPAGTLTQARSEHTATLLPAGRVLVVGGPGSDGTLATAEVWEPSEGQSADG